MPSINFDTALDDSIQFANTMWKSVKIAFVNTNILDFLKSQQARIQFCFQNLALDSENKNDFSTIKPDGMYIETMN